MKVRHIVTITSVILVAMQCVAAQVPGCFTSENQCCKYCEGAFGTCPSGWEQSHEEVPGHPPGCYCCRPFTTEEQQQLHVEKCGAYLSACSPSQRVSCNLAAYECAQAAPYSDLRKLCEKSSTACRVMCINVHDVCSRDSRSDRCDIFKNLPECNAPDHTDYGTVAG
ncbi:hypothetical protein F5H01DRAFT_331977 [Linnemannia elongata]|nr:hypothetical protein F5H01DRAFT_331977 [Linnemannia elongata]